MVVQTWTDVIVGSLQNLWLILAGFLPKLIGALIVLIIGLVVATGIGALVERIFMALKLDALLARMGLEPHFDRAGLRLRASRFLGQVVYWFLVIAFLLAASDILGLGALSVFLRDVLAYMPNIVVAVLIMLAAVVLANLVRRVVIASVLSARLHAAHFLGTLAWWSLVVFGILAALVQLDIAVAIINTVITGIIAMIALAGGIAFGLGGRDYAAHLLKKLQEQTESH